MKRILIGSALVALCAAVALAQAPKSTTTLTPGTIAPGGTLQKTVPPTKKGTTSTPGGLLPAVTPTQRFQTQNLAMSNGTAFNATFDRDRNVFKVPLANGTYQLNNGGAIRVRGGVIVWDAFGVIERLKVPGATAHDVDPDGLG